MAEKKVRQTDRQTDRQNDKQTNKQTDNRNKKTIAPDRVGDYNDKQTRHSHRHSPRGAIGLSFVTVRAKVIILFQAELRQVVI